jgi:hypothetical protein
MRLSAWRWVWRSRRGVLEAHMSRTDNAPDYAIAPVDVTLTGLDGFNLLRASGRAGLSSGSRLAMTLAGAALTGLLAGVAWTAWQRSLGSAPARQLAAIDARLAALGPQLSQCDAQHRQTDALNGNGPEAVLLDIRLKRPVVILDALARRAEVVLTRLEIDAAGTHIRGRAPDHAALAGWSKAVDAAAGRLRIVRTSRGDAQARPADGDFGSDLPVMFEADLAAGTIANPFGAAPHAPSAASHGRPDPARGPA